MRVKRDVMLSFRQGIDGCYGLVTGFVVVTPGMTETSANVARQTKPSRTPAKAGVTMKLADYERPTMPLP
ncbi:hypothetical protein ASE91_01530 [Sphingomonas sp. Leaf62]|nr:hypothetical protein ASE91_01530 [Sphingomonas sp. Leaf62]